MDGAELVLRVTKRFAKGANGIKTGPHAKTPPRRKAFYKRGTALGSAHEVSRLHAAYYTKTRLASLEEAIHGNYNVKRVLGAE